MRIKVMTKGLMIKTRSRACESKIFRVRAMVLHFSICVFRFLFLFLCLSTHPLNAEVLPEHTTKGHLTTNSLAATANDANQASVVSEKPQQNGPSVAGKTTLAIGNQLRRDRISAPQNKKNNGNKDELKKLIEQIRSIEFKPQKTPEPAIVVNPAPAEEPNEPSFDIPAQKEPEPKLPYNPVADQTLQMLKSKSQGPEQVANPFQLAEILFLSGQLKEAAVFYQEALKRTDPNDASVAEDRAWILLQIGNCLRKDDLPTAMKMYRQLVAEHPDSRWSDLAKTLEKLIDWYQKDKPKELIAQFKL